VKGIMLAAALLALMLPMGACGDDEGDVAGTGDPRISKIGGIAEAATTAYAAAGAGAIADYLSSDLADKCTNEDIKRALADDVQPTGFKTIKNVRFQSDDRATATIVLITREGDKEVEWSFIREGDDSWRIVEMPGLSREDCGAS